MSIPPGTDTEKIIHRGVPLLNGIAHCDMGGGGGGVTGCDVFLQCDCKRLSSAVYRTLEHLWEVEVGNVL